MRVVSCGPLSRGIAGPGLLWGVVRGIVSCEKGEEGWRFCRGGGGRCYFGVASEGLGGRLETGERGLVVVVVPVVMVVVVFVPVLRLVLVLVLPVFNFLLRTSERGVPVWVEGGQWGRFPIQYFLLSLLAGTGFSLFWGSRRNWSAYLIP